jgi:hypothetical protein
VILITTFHLEKATHYRIAAHCLQVDPASFLHATCTCARFFADTCERSGMWKPKYRIGAVLRSALIAYAYAPGMLAVLTPGTSG